MKSKNQIEVQLEEALENIDNVGKIEPGSGAWRRAKGYIDALEWVLEI